jgi:aminopeptidase N
MNQQLDLASNPSPTITKIKLEDYKPPAFIVLSAYLQFDLQGDTATITAETKYERRDGAPEIDLRLDGSAHFELVDILIDDVALSENQYCLEEDHALTILDLPKRFTLSVTTRLNAAENTRLEGLYKSSGNFCTQCEAEGFRHITYFLDRPDVLTAYKVRIEADKSDYPVLLSNGNLLETGSLEHGKHFALWEDPFPKPCYLFAMVAGDLAVLSDTYVTKSGREVALNIYAIEADIDKCDYAMGALKRAMKWDEDRFGLEYDLDIYNIVAVSDFNMGAMENKGLNVFNTKYVLAKPDTATDQDYANIEGVIGHEYFHNWTGNRVTCRDWFQLSLKEGLTVFRDQEFSSDLGSRAIKRLDDVRVLRMHQFPEDAGPLAHPVRPEEYVEINNFYTATVYNKGAEVIRMMNSLIGEVAFQKGMKLYFDRHDGCAVTCEDFIVSMEDASGLDLSQFRRWYSQPGTPQISVTRKKVDGGVAVLNFSQSPPTVGDEETHKPYHIPIKLGWVHPETGKSLGNDQLIELIEPEQDFSCDNIPENSVPSILRDFSAPVILSTDLTDSDLLTLAIHDSDPFVRVDSMHTIARNQVITRLNGGGNEQLEKQLIDAIGMFIDNGTIDVALVSELISLPSEIAIGQYVENLDPDSLHVIRSAIIDKVAQTFSETILARYEQLCAMSSPGPYDRRLKNGLLSYIARLPIGEQVVGKQFQNASNMTDHFAALVLIASSSFNNRETWLNDFYNQWKNDELVLDKWFSAQAMSNNDNVVSEIEALLKHPDFSFTNPNRLRSVISTFSILNQKGFHAHDGSGYNLLCQTIKRVDQINPQVAARMVAPFGQWRRFDKNRQNAMKDNLKLLMGDASISKDVRELVEKSL